MKESFKKRVRLFLQKSGKKPVSIRELVLKCKIKRPEMGEFNAAVLELIQHGIVIERKMGLILADCVGCFGATVTRVNRTFGFIKREKDESEVFVPGKFLMGAMPGDTVLAKLIESRASSKDDLQRKDEGEVVRILNENNARFTGIIVEDEGVQFILPDTFTKMPIKLIDNPGNMVHREVGDKVLAEISVRGSRHSEHVATIISRFGSSESAEACVNSYLELNGVMTQFSVAVEDEAKTVSSKKIAQSDYDKRVDLSGEIIFTIDGADTKDIDDAVSVKKYRDFYELSVHIADVSHYVKPNSQLDKEALERGTSIYYADSVIPMLPKALSNGICSLNPNEDRLAFSCIIIIGFDGQMQDFDFKKTIVHSKLKGVYSEINQILAGNESSVVTEKYAKVRENIFLMKELADILTSNKLKRGAPQLETTESKFVIKDGICIDVIPRERGESEMIIEEFMLMANQAAARLGSMQDIPFVYRVHENPGVEKIVSLKEALLKMGVAIPNFDQIKPMHMSQILESTKGTKLFPVVNKLVLRSMAKAKYSAEPIGHFGLVLKDYAHFTSPIRRYPDLAVHRILSDLVAGVPAVVLKKKYGTFSTTAAKNSTDTELLAMRLERDCEDCYKAEMMSWHIGEKYSAVISSVVDYGFYIELPNTIEGLVHVETLPSGNYSFDGRVTLREIQSNKSYTVGDEVTVICTKADISNGKVDFSTEQI